MYRQHTLQAVEALAAVVMALAATPVVTQEPLLWCCL
jgi:hypothetical protein